MRFTEIDLVRRLRRADLVDDGGSVADHGRTARMAAHFGLLRYVWHPPLFVFAVYTIVLSVYGPPRRTLKFAMSFC